MAIIQTFLLDKLSDAIEKAKSSTFSSPDLSQLEKDCNELKNSIGEKFNSKITEKLYSLNNEILLLRNRHHFNIETRRLINNLRKTLAEIKDELPRRASYTCWTKNTNVSEKNTYRWSTRLTDPNTKIPSFEDRAMERLLVGGFKSIGLVGMAGVGKTTLCQVSFRNLKVMSHFFPRIWICMSRQPKDDPDFEKEVARRMLTCLGFEDKVVDKLEGQLIFAVRQQLKGKRCLTVFDDVDEDWSGGLPEGCDGTVIVTTRSRNVAENIVGRKKVYGLLPVMNKERCWDIFMGAAEKDGKALPVDVSEIKGDIVERCGGLPLVAKMMGQIVHEKNQNKKESYN
ncbi:hypothetical protein CASFOL_028986 [Castilleja foliolosa]|uniref:NB-ARC domain-containing protein n=1 Tax=Castilleja foliolosa TaxID=1961234 RepID=A0ABD3CCR0_9LAMI